MATTPNLGLPLLDSAENVSEDHHKINVFVEELDTRLGEIAVTLAGLAVAGHSHEMGKINGLTEALGLRALVDHVHHLNDLADVDVTDAPDNSTLQYIAGKWSLAQRGYSAEEINNLLAFKASTEHQHDTGDVSGLQEQLDDLGLANNVALDAIATELGKKAALDALNSFTKMLHTRGGIYVGNTAIGNRRQIGELGAADFEEFFSLHGSDGNLNIYVQDGEGRARITWNATAGDSSVQVSGDTPWELDFIGSYGSDGIEFKRANPDDAPYNKDDPIDWVSVFKLEGASNSHIGGKAIVTQENVKQVAAEAGAGSKPVPDAIYQHTISDNTTAGYSTTFYSVTTFNTTLKNENNVLTRSGNTFTAQEDCWVEVNRYFRKTSDAELLIGGQMDGTGYLNKATRYVPDDMEIIVSAMVPKGTSFNIRSRVKNLDSEYAGGRKAFFSPDNAVVAELRAWRA
ncbi:hypothetical protein ACMG4P_05000 [Pseudovibrio denitrificans]|uniref:hypothetical protein n=1 Tax=Pseudovibrio denitrificans TaxID=258256 RepID=UPI0039BEDA72